MNHEKQNIILCVFNVITILILFSLSVPFLSEILRQFFSESSTFKLSEVPIKEFPTITICTPYKSFEYGPNLNISITLGMFNHYVHLEEGKNTITWSNNKEDKIILKQFYSRVVGGFCYQITKNISYKIENMDDGYNSLLLSFNKSITYDELPDIEFFLTSDENSPGVLYYEWMNGDELHLPFPKVSIEIRILFSCLLFKQSTSCRINGCYIIHG